MTTEEHVALLARRPEYAIIEYLIDERSIIMFVDKLTPEQNEIPKIIDGKKVVLAQSI